VARYAYRCRTGSSAIFSVRHYTVEFDGQTQATSYATIEVHPGTMKVVQIRSCRNRPVNNTIMTIIHEPRVHEVIDKRSPWGLALRQASRGKYWPHSARSAQRGCHEPAQSEPIPSMLWLTRNRTFDFRHRGAIMGVLNVTPDSFSDGGRWLDVDAAVAHAREMGAQGAEIIDVGGESTRPGAEPVDESEELRRVLPVIERLAGTQAIAISIDTMKPAVARAAVERGAEIINDITGLRHPAMREVVRETGAAAIIMHMQGEPRTMQAAPNYEDVTREVGEFFRQALESCLASGIDPMRLAFDPGIGFGKTVAHNLALLGKLELVRVGGRPIVVGVSRKSFLGKVTGSERMEGRAWPTVALTSFLRERGANVLRVHDVRPNVQALRMTEAILHGVQPA